MTQPNPNPNDSQSPEPDSSAQSWLEESSGLLELVDEEQQEKKRRKQQEQEKKEQERRKWEELMQQTFEEQKRLEREPEQERATWNRDSNSGNFAGYHVRRPNGSWYQGRNESPVDQDPNEQDNSDNFPGRGHRLGTGELPPSPEQPTVAQRRAAALAAIERRQVTDRSKSTREDQSQSHGR